MPNVKFTDWSGGINQAKNPTELDPKDALELRNQGETKGGTLKKRNGTARYDCQAAGEIIGLTQVDLYGRKFRLIADKSGVISKLDTTLETLTSLKTGLSTLDSQYWSFATDNDMPVLMTNGIDRPLLFDGDEVRECGEYDKPFIMAPIVSNEVGGNANFKIKVSWYDQPNNYEGGISNPSPVARGMRGEPQLRVNLATLKMNIPSRFTHIRFYRTMSDGESFFYCGQVLATESTATLLTKDSELGNMPRFQDSPMPALRQIVAGKGRFWAAGCRRYSEGLIARATNGSTEIEGNATNWTNAMVGKFITIGDDYSHRYIAYDIDKTNQILRIRPPYRGATDTDLTYEIFNSEWTLFYCAKSPLGQVLPENWGGANRIDARFGVGEGFQGIGKVAGEIAVFLYNNIMFIEGDGPADYKLVQAPKAVTGTCSYRSIASDGQGSIYFLSTHNYGIWKYTPRSQEKVMENIGDLVRDKLKALDQSKFQYAHAVFIEGRYKIWLSTDDAVGGEIGDICFVWDGVRWSEEEGIQVSAAGKITDSGVPKPMVGGEYGFVSKQDTGTNDGANLIAAAERSGTAESGSGTTITDTAQSWGTDVLKGLYINIVSGTGKGQRRKIQSNTNEGVITLTRALTTALDITSVYAIGAIRFLRRFAWLSPQNVLRYWVGKIHQVAQDSGNLILRFYKDYDITQANLEKTVSLASGVVSVGVKQRADAFAIEFVQDDVDVDFDIYAFIVELKEIVNKPARQEKTQEEDENGNSSRTKRESRSRSERS